jgi:hypothetical protein
MSNIVVNLGHCQNAKNQPALPSSSLLLLLHLHHHPYSSSSELSKFEYAINALDPSNTTGVLLEVIRSRDVDMLKLLLKSCLGLLDPNIVIARLHDFTLEGENWQEVKERREECESVREP